MAQEILILYIMCQKFDKPLMIYLVKEAFDIGLHHIVDLVCHDRLVDIPHYVVR